MSLTLLKKSMEIIENDNECKQQAERGGKDPKVTTSKRRGVGKHRPSTAKANSKVAKDPNRKTDLNVRRLLAMSQNTVKVADAEKIVNRAHKGRYQKITLPKVEQESIFTEEDFRAFEEEYFRS